MSACTSVRRIQPSEYFSKNSPDVVWVTYTNKTVVPVAQPDVVGDTLKGTRQGTSQVVAIPLDQVLSVRARTPDNAKTAVLITGALTGLVASVYALWISKAGPRTGGIDCGVNEDAQPIPFC